MGFQLEGLHRGDMQQLRGTNGLCKTMDGDLDLGTRKIFVDLHIAFDELNESWGYIFYLFGKKRAKLSYDKVRGSKHVTDKSRHGREQVVDSLFVCGVVFLEIPQIFLQGLMCNVLREYFNDLD